MAIGFPVKDDYATGDILTAANMNDLAGTVNTVSGAFFAAGKNKIINGDFSINQRGFTSTTSDGSYGFDRWLFSNTGVSCTFTPQTFTPGTAPVAGYEAINFARILTTGQTLSSERTILQQRVEDVRTFAAQTVTFSFWAKANSGTPKIALEIAQNFGSGGSSQVTNYVGQVTLSTSWVRYSGTIAMPSILGKTVGTSSFIGANLWLSAGSDFNSRTGSLGIQSNTFDIWGVQVEAGSVATAFQTATGTIQGELAACQRYYVRLTNTGTGAHISSGGGCATATIAQAPIALPVTLRVNPTSVEISNVDWYNYGNITQYNTGTFTLATGDRNFPLLRYTHGTNVFTAGQFGAFVTTSANGYIAFSAEI